MPTPTPVWQPGQIEAPEKAGPRGMLDLRGLVHAHSIHSHDACDGHPVLDGGGYDSTCLDDFRRGLCQSKHNFVMLTDHRAMFEDTDFPEALLYRSERGDQLIERQGDPVANWAGGCDDGTPPALILAGSESGTMPVGLERHVAGRGEVYGQATADAIGLEKAQGAVSLVAHTEDWTPEDLTSLPLDGFEMFNLHANTLLNAGVALEMITRLSEGATDLPAPDLALFGVITEHPTYLSTWGTVLARGAHRVTTMGTDCHRNTFQDKLADGERIDSYRRMMIAFSNHLLVRPQPGGAWDDRDLKEALRAGRLYGVFEYLGYARGFDFTASEAGATHEMGETVSLARGVELHVSMPALSGLPQGAEPPELTIRVLRAKESGWDEVMRGTGDLTVPITTPGAYRAEVRMLPHHLKAFLGRDASKMSKTDKVWVYSNAIYVDP